MKWTTVDPALSAIRAEAGRKGAAATLERHGRDQVAAWGRRGGRPRLPTLEELEKQHTPAYEHSAVVTNSDERSDAARRDSGATVQQNRAGC